MVALMWMATLARTAFYDGITKIRVNCGDPNVSMTGALSS